MKHQYFFLLIVMMLLSTCRNSGISTAVGNNGNSIKKTRYIPVEESLSIWVETFGNVQDEAVLLIAGAGAISSFWSDSFCEKIAHEGFFVIKYDHRDIGYSSKINYREHPYGMDALTNDVCVILDSLQVKDAHMIGHSMGGFIAQRLAISCTERVNSIVSISSSSSSPDVPRPSPILWFKLFSGIATNDIEHDLPRFLRKWKLLNGTASFSEELASAYTVELYRRQVMRGKFAKNHYRAMESLLDRTEELKHLTIPALVIHGEEDELIEKIGGIQTAAAIPYAELKLIPQMGHMPFNEQIILQLEKEISSFLQKQKHMN